MRRTKYYYDAETLTYKKVRRSKRIYVLRSLAFLVASGMMGFGFYFFTSELYDSPETRRARAQNKYLELQLEEANQQLDQLERVIADVERRDNSIYRIYFDASPITDEQRQAGYGGVNRYSSLEGYDKSSAVIELRNRIDKLKKRTAIQSESLDEIAVLAADKEKLLSSIPAIQPVRNEDLTRMASGYGYRTDPFNKTRKFHYGMDFTAPRGTPIFATGDGRVTRADNRSSGYGNHVRIDHGFGYVTLYAHMRRRKPFNVRRGQRVKRGDIIGYVGSTGRSEAAHLHYEVFKDGRRINPINFYYGKLSPDEFNELLEKSQVENISLD